MRIILLTKKEEAIYLHDLEEIAHIAGYTDYKYFVKGANIIERFFGLTGLYYGKMKSEERIRNNFIIEQESKAKNNGGTE